MCCALQPKHTFKAWKQAQTTCKVGQTICSAVSGVEPQADPEELATDDEDGLTPAQQLAARLQQQALEVCHLLCL